MIYALNSTKHGKALDAENLPVDIFNLLKEDYIPVLAELFNEICKNRVISRE